MKKNKKNKISPKKSTTPSITTQQVKEARNERKEIRRSFEKGIISKRGVSKILKSMGGVKKGRLSEEDKLKITKAQVKFRENREKQYEARRIAALKRRYKRGEKTPEELKVAIEDLKKSIAEAKRYDILCTFPKPSKSMVREMLLNEEIKYAVLSDDYFWVRDTTTDCLNKLREIMPDAVTICPYRATTQKVVNNCVGRVKTKKPTNNTSDKKKAAKSNRKVLKMNNFKHRMKNVKKAA